MANRSAESSSNHPLATANCDTQQCAFHGLSPAHTRMNFRISSDNVKVSASFTHRFSSRYVFMPKAGVTSPFCKQTSISCSHMLNFVNKLVNPRFKEYLFFAFPYSPPLLHFFWTRSYHQKLENSTRLQGVKLLPPSSFILL